MTLRQHNSKHFDRTFGAAAVLPVWTASAVKQLAHASLRIWNIPSYLLHAFTGSGIGSTHGLNGFNGKPAMNALAATANLPQLAVERIADYCDMQGGKQVSRVSKLRRGYLRISSNPVA